MLTMAQPMVMQKAHLLDGSMGMKWVRPGDLLKAGQALSPRIW